MRKELANKFPARWPNWFRGMTKSPMESNMAFGLECADGWFQLLWDLCLELEQLGVPEDFEIYQIKEKFGGLRFYTSGSSIEAYNAVEQAEKRSYEICEECGSTEGVTVAAPRGWITTKCAECRAKQMKRYEESA